MFGDDCQRLNSKQVNAPCPSARSLHQAHNAIIIDRIRSIHLRYRCSPSRSPVYIALHRSLSRNLRRSPTWGNYKPAFNLVGLDIQEYSYYNRKEQAFDLSSSLDAIRTAPPSSVFIFQGCCHNPTAQDPTTASGMSSFLPYKQVNIFPFLT